MTVEVWHELTLPFFLSWSVSVLCIISQAVPCNKTHLNSWGFFQFILTFLMWRKFAVNELLTWGTECLQSFWSIPTCPHEISVEIVIDISCICHLTWNAYLTWIARGCDWNLMILCKVLYRWRPFDVLCIWGFALDRWRAWWGSTREFCIAQFLVGFLWFPYQFGIFQKYIK